MERKPEQISRDIAAFERKLTEAGTNEVLIDALKKKLTKLKNELKGGQMSARQLASNLLGARKKVKEMLAKDFKELILRLAKKPEYYFLKRYSKSEIKNDMSRPAKPVGYRFVGRGNYDVPSKRQIKKGLADGTVYSERRPKRSDVSRTAQLEKGGSIGYKNWDNLTFEEKKHLVLMIIDQATWRSREWGENLIKGQFDELAYNKSNIEKLFNWVKSSEGKKTIMGIFKENETYWEGYDTKLESYEDLINDELGLFGVDSMQNEIEKCQTKMAKGGKTSAESRMKGLQDPKKLYALLNEAEANWSKDEGAEYNRIGALIKENRKNYYNLLNQAEGNWSKDGGAEYKRLLSLQSQYYAKGGSMYATRAGEIITLKNDVHGLGSMGLKKIKEGEDVKFLEKLNNGETLIEYEGFKYMVDLENKMAKGGSVKPTIKIKRRLEQIRKSIQNENVSYGELAELQSLSQYIDPNDIELKQAAGIPEFDEDEMAKGGSVTLRTYKIDLTFDNEYFQGGKERKKQFKKTFYAEAKNVTEANKKAIRYLKKDLPLAEKISIVKTELFKEGGSMYATSGDNTDKKLTKQEILSKYKGKYLDLLIGEDGKHEVIGVSNNKKPRYFLAEEWYNDLYAKGGSVQGLDEMKLNQNSKSLIKKELSNKWNVSENDIRTYSDPYVAEITFMTRKGLPSKKITMDEVDFIEAIYNNKLSELLSSKMAKGGSVKPTIKIKRRLEQIRKSIQNENVSYGELAELQSLSQYIDPNDIELKQAAGISEFDEDEMAKGGEVNPLLEKTQNWLNEKKEVYIEAGSSIPKPLADLLPVEFVKKTNDKLERYYGGRYFNTLDKQLLSKLTKQGLQVHLGEGSDDYTLLIAGSNEDEMAKGGSVCDYTTKELNDFEKKYEKNEAINHHTENLVLLAEMFGTKADKVLVKEIQTRHNRDGSIEGKNAEKYHKLYKKLSTKWKKACKDAGVKCYANGGNIDEMSDEEVEERYSEILSLQILAGDVDEDELEDAEELSIEEKRNFLKEFDEDKYENGGSLVNKIKDHLTSKNDERKPGSQIVWVNDTSRNSIYSNSFYPCFKENIGKVTFLFDGTLARKDFRLLVFDINNNIIKQFTSTKKTKKESVEDLKKQAENWLSSKEMAKGGEISVYNLRKGDKVRTRKGDIETIIKKTGSGSYTTIENDYSHSPESLEFVSRPGRKMGNGGEVSKAVEIKREMYKVFESFLNDKISNEQLLTKLQRILGKRRWFRYFQGDTGANDLYSVKFGLTSSLSNKEYEKENMQYAIENKSLQIYDYSGNEIFAEGGSVGNSKLSKLIEDLQKKLDLYELYYEDDEVGVAWKEFKELKTRKSFKEFVDLVEKYDLVEGNIGEDNVNYNIPSVRDEVAEDIVSIWKQFSDFSEVVYTNDGRRFFVYDKDEVKLLQNKHEDWRFAKPVMDKEPLLTNMFEEFKKSKKYNNKVSGWDLWSDFMEWGDKENKFEKGGSVDETMTRSKIREAIAESSKMKVADVVAYFKSRYPKADMKIVREEAKEMIDEAKRFN